MVMSDRKTNIQVSRSTRDALADMGRKGDTYDDILRRLCTRVYNWDRVHVVSIPFHTRNGIQYMDVILPKVESMNIPDVDFISEMKGLCEGNDIEILSDEEVPFFNEHF